MPRRLRSATLETRTARFKLPIKKKPYTARVAPGVRVAAMGDRFVLVRSDSNTGRISAGTRAIRNTGAESAMRKELAEAVAGLIGHVDPDQPHNLTNEEADHILQAADIVTLARTGVEIDYRGDVIDAHMPEMPTRVARQLTQILRGARAIGMTPAGSHGPGDPLRAGFHAAAAAGHP